MSVKNPQGLPFTAQKIVQLPVKDLIPYARNSRTHSELQVAQLASAMREWGWTSPVLVDEDGGIIAGHGRVLAAQKLNLKSVPAIVASGWTKAQKQAFVIWDNKSALNAGWDNDMLRIELQDLMDSGFNVELAGFEEEELAAILADKNAGLTDPDDVPETPVNPVSKLGDVWVLGRHRITCGDCTDPTVVARVLNGVRPHLMVTDPPYGVEYNPAWRVTAGVGGSGTATGKVLNDDRADWREAWALFPGDVAYVWHAGTFAGDVAASLEATKFKVRAQIVWVKTRHVLSRGDYHHQHEPCFYGVRDGKDENWNFVPEHEVSIYAVKKGAVGHYVGGRKQSTVWFIEHLKSDTGHGTQKPVACMQRPIENNSSAGQAVYDPFLGSGTTLIAAEISGRSCHGSELNPAYCDVAVKRWENFTGQKAVLEKPANGKPSPQADAGAKSSGRKPRGNRGNAEANLRDHEAGVRHAS
jgi:DNA modification methylase